MCKGEGSVFRLLPRTSWKMHEYTHVIVEAFVIDSAIVVFIVKAPLLRACKLSFIARAFRSFVSSLSAFSEPSTATFIFTAAARINSLRNRRRFLRRPGFSRHHSCGRYRLTLFRNHFHHRIASTTFTAAA